MDLYALAADTNRDRSTSPAPGLCGRRCASEGEGCSPLEFAVLPDVSSSSAPHHHSNHSKDLGLHHAIRWPLLCPAQGWGHCMTTRGTRPHRIRKIASVFLILFCIPQSLYG